MKIIEVTIDKSGKTSFDVQGACGTECQALTAPLERVLGGKGISTPKPELYQAQPQTQTAQQ